MPQEDRLKENDKIAEQQQTDLLAGRYRVLGRIGEGGMGEVFRVEQVFLHQELALKTLNRSSMTDAIVRRFQQEARAAFALDHPNLVKVHDSGILEDDRPFLVMDLVKGKTLSETFKDKTRLSLEEAVPVFVQACFGIAYAHQLGIVHRDIKPSNIMLVEGAAAGTEGSVKILDFGIARFMQHEGGEIQALTKTGEIFGSPLYMSPEQCAGERVDHRSDIYSLGCVLFEALTGTPPFVGENALATMIQHQSTTAGSLREASLGVEFSQAIEVIVRKMMAKNPADRYQDLGPVAHDLQSASQGAQISSLAAASPVTDSGKGGISHRTLFTLVTLTAILCGAAGYLAGTSKSASKAPDPSNEAMKLELKRYDTRVFPTDEEYDKDEVELKKQLALDDHGWVQWKYHDVSLKTLSKIASTPWITAINFDACNFDDTANLAVLARLPHLGGLSLARTNIDNKGLDALTACPLLHSVEMPHTQVDDAGLQSLRKIKNLTYVRLGGCPLTGQGYQELANMSFLTTLNLGQSRQFTSEYCRYFVGSNVQNFNLLETAVDDAGMAYLAKMRQLNNLNVARTAVTAKGIEQLGRSPSLKNVCIEGCKNISSSEIAALRQKFKGKMIIVDHVD